MLLKILVVGALLVGMMAAIRDGRILKDAGLLSSCNSVTPQLLSCSKGRLDGWPDMSNQSCNLIAVHPSREYWQCVAPVVSSRSPKG